MYVAQVRERKDRCVNVLSVGNSCYAVIAPVRSFYFVCWGWYLSLFSFFNALMLPFFHSNPCSLTLFVCRGFSCAENENS